MTSVAYNMDCVEAMREMPDNAYDLAVVDPPYGSGLTENGGCQGWFSKHHQTNDSQSVKVERERESCLHTTGSGVLEAGLRSTSAKWNRFGQRFDRYKNLDNRHTQKMVERSPEQAERGQKSTPKKS